MSFLKKYATQLVLALIVGLYFYFAYFLERTEFYTLLILWISLFGCSYYLYQREKENDAFLASISILFRLVFLFAIPNLSQDFYRFIWDGRMILEGFNPYISLPETFIQQRIFPIAQAPDLYDGMGMLNGSHYTNYPPVNQLNFLIAAIVSSSSILGAAIAMRIQIILADIGIIYFGRKILKKLKLPTNNIFLYALNPFIIIELTGNLHFEPVMLFFLVWSLYLLLHQKWIWAAIVLGFSVSVKLIPLLFLPLFFQWFTRKPLDSARDDINLSGRAESRPFSFQGFGRLILFGAIVIFINILLFLPFLSSELVSSYTNSVGLWFRSFEFNASFYYLAREIGYLFRGYNEIAIIGKIMPAIAVLFLLSISIFRKNKTPQQLITALLIGLTFYYFTTTTMHPWYLATLVLLSVFTKYRFSILWSLVIIVTYFAYSVDPWKENLWLVAFEYLVVFGTFIWEISRQKTTRI